MRFEKFNAAMIFKKSSEERSVDGKKVSPPQPKK